MEDATAKGASVEAVKQAGAAARKALCEGSSVEAALAAGVAASAALGTAVGSAM